MTIPTLYHDGHGREQLGDDTPVYYASEEGSREVAVWFQRPFDKYNGYSMQNALFKRLTKRNVDKVYIVDFVNKVMTMCTIESLKCPEKIILKNEKSKEELSNYHGIVVKGKVLPEVIIERNSDTDDLQRLVTKNQLRMVERNLEYYRSGGQSYRELVLTDMGQD